MAIVIASDGLRARDNGSWGRDKLAFLDAFGPPALMATSSKRQRFYLDLFAGPGRNVDRGGRGAEFEGSPIRALRMTAQERADLAFTHAFFVNESRRDYVALEARIRRLVDSGDCRIPPDQIVHILGDTNQVLPDVMARIHPQAYVLVFADITAPKHWPFSSVRALRQQGHQSVDLYLLFPLQMAIQRLIGYARTGHQRFAHILDPFFGTPAWRDLADQRQSEAQSPVLRRQLEELYLSQLETLWPHTGAVKEVRLRGNQILYKMLFASRHDAGKRIASWAKRQEGDRATGQGELFGKA